MEREINKDKREIRFDEGGEKKNHAYATGEQSIR